MSQASLFYPLEAPPRADQPPALAEIVRFWVHGVAQPKGSMRSFVSKTSGKVVTMNARPGTKHWQTDVADVARMTMQGRDLERGPVEVTVVFHLPRPKGHRDSKGAVRPAAPRHPATKPDVDKLARNVLDALTGTVFLDDSQVAVLVCRKRYADTEPGASVAVRRLG